MQETRGSRILDYFYDANGQAIAVRYKSNANATGTYYYYAYNWRGDIVGLYAENGNPECTYTYDAWGKLLSVKNPAGTEMTSATYIGNLQSLKYRGYVYDRETGLYYLQSRYYDPVTRRFINADGLVSTGSGVLGYNMFSYCVNNPVVFIDAIGNSPYGPLDITDYYRIHRRIQEKISNEKNWDMEVGVYRIVDGRKKRGRLDLYDIIKNEFYEIKSSGSASTAEEQIERYENSVGFTNKKYTFTEKLNRGTEKISDYIDYGIYHITYGNSKLKPELIIYHVPDYRSIKQAQHAPAFGASYSQTSSSNIIPLILTGLGFAGLGFSGSGGFLGGGGGFVLTTQLR